MDSISGDSKPLNRITRSNTFHKLDKFNNSQVKIFDSSAHNKSTAFTQSERKKYKLWGLIPAAVETLEAQTQRALKQVRAFETPLEQYIYLDRIRSLNQVLFYSLLMTDLKFFLPLVYTPTVGKACLTFSLNYRSPSGLYITPDMKGHIHEVLENWYYPDVDICVASDGSRILGLGDLGVNGMGIPIGKLSLYVAGAGFDPSKTLPVMFDVGVDNTQYLNDPHYLGIKQKRIPAQEYNELVDEFIEAFFKKWPEAVFQFEDFQTDRAFSLLQRHRENRRCFNDDIQGTGVVIAAGMANALKISLKKTESIKDVKIVFLGAGSAAVGVADSITSMLVDRLGCTREEAKMCIYLIDSQGVVTNWRKNRGGRPLAPHKLSYSRDDLTEHKQENLKDLFTIIKILKPKALVGLASQPGAFTEEILKYMGDINERPIILSLSNPNSKSECSAEDAYKATDGRAIFGSGSPWPSYDNNGKTLTPSQANNMFCFPGIGLGAAISQTERITNAQLHSAAIALANLVSDEELEQGALYPPINQVRKCSAHVAAAVAAQAEKEGLAKASCEETWLKAAQVYMWTPEYPISPQ